MRRSEPGLAVILVVASALVTLTGRVVDAQQIDTAAMTPLQTAVACAPPPSFDGAPANALHIIGSQDPEPRALFSIRDLLVVDGGTDAGVQLDQEYFIRRSNAYLAKASGFQIGSRTVGWIRVVAVNESTAIARVDHVCGGILQMDYLEPFVIPEIPDGVERDETPGEPDFTSLGRIIGGNENRQIAGPGDFVLIDQGRDHGVVPGSRFAIYRDLGVAGLPLSTVGEVVMISVGRTVAVGRITRARDAAHTGDYVAPRR
jgi:hypothetical protein